MYDLKSAILSRPPKHEKSASNTWFSQVLIDRPAGDERGDCGGDEVHVPLSQRQGGSCQEGPVWRPLHQDCARYTSSTSLKVAIYRVQKLGVAQGSGSHAAETCPFGFARGSSPLITSRRCTYHCTVILRVALQVALTVILHVALLVARYSHTPCSTAQS